MAEQTKDESAAAQPEPLTLEALAERIKELEQRVKQLEREREQRRQVEQHLRARV